MWAKCYLSSTATVNLRVKVSTNRSMIYPSIPTVINVWLMSHCDMRLFLRVTAKFEPLASSVPGIRVCGT
jgi:hypothetical protein